MTVCAGLGARLRSIESGKYTEIECWIPFTATSWNGLYLTIIRFGVPLPGQIGPHELPLGKYDVSVYHQGTMGWEREVDVDVRTNSLTGEVLLIRCARAKAFDGAVIVDWARSYDA